MRLRPPLQILLIVAGIWALMSSFPLCVQDDAYISFRYARNLALGHGLVFNPGEWVEGYTNFLWTILFAPIIAIGLDPTGPAVMLGMASVGALVWSAWELGGRHWLPPLLVACYPGLALEGVQGLESAFFAFLFCQALRGGPRWSVWAGLAALTRPEGYALFGLLWLWRRRPRDLLFFGALTIPHLAWRVFRYGGLVPNTFHAKAGDVSLLQGSAVPRGLGYLWESALAGAPLFLAAVLGIAMLFRLREDKEPLKQATVLLGFFTVYIVAVGGDFKGTGRFLLPLLAPAAVLALAGLRTLPKPATIVVGLAAIMWAVPGWQTMNRHAQTRHAFMDPITEAGLALKALAEPDWLVAVHAIGLVPYYSELPTLDMWGLTDAHIARAKTTETLGTGKAGHERGDFAYVRSQRPAVILPGPTLVSTAPLDLGDPGVFGPDFLHDYRALSVPLSRGHLNLWLRADLTLRASPP